MARGAAGRGSTGGPGRWPTARRAEPTARVQGRGGGARGPGHSQPRTNATQASERKRRARGAARPLAVSAIVSRRASRSLGLRRARGGVGGTGGGRGARQIKAERAHRRASTTKMLIRKMLHYLTRNSQHKIQMQTHLRPIYAHTPHRTITRRTCGRRSSRGALLQDEDVIVRR